MSGDCNEVMAALVPMLSLLRKLSVRDMEKAADLLDHNQVSGRGIHSDVVHGLHDQMMKAINGRFGPDVLQPLTGEAIIVIGTILQSILRRYLELQHAYRQDPEGSSERIRQAVDGSKPFVFDSLWPIWETNELWSKEKESDDKQP